MRIETPVFDAIYDTTRKLFYELEPANAREDAVVEKDAAIQAGKATEIIIRSFLDRKI